MTAREAFAPMFANRPGGEEPGVVRMGLLDESERAPHWRTGHHRPGVGPGVCCADVGCGRADIVGGSATTPGGTGPVRHRTIGTTCTLP